MNEPGSDAVRLARLLGLADREAHHLLAVRQWLLDSDCAVSVERLAALLDDDIGIDRLESFGAKFSRMQDTLVDKLIPAILRAAGERTVAAIDNLARMERLGLIAQANAWLEMRGLRNRLVHEYIDRPEELAPALERACRFTGQLHTEYLTIRDYAINRLGAAPESIG